MDVFNDQFCSPFQVDHIAQFIIQTRFVCQFNIEGRVTSVNAQLLSDTIFCDEMEFTYSSRFHTIPMTFLVGAISLILVIITGRPMLLPPSLLFGDNTNHWTIRTTSGYSSIGVNQWLKTAECVTAWMKNMSVAGVR